MLRLTWDATGQPPRLLTQDELVRELEDLAARDFRAAPGGPIVVEELDPKFRTRWRGYYTSAAELRPLLVQLRAERAMAREGGGA